MHKNKQKEMTCNNPISSDESENNVNFEDDNEIIVDDKITIDKFSENNPELIAKNIQKIIYNSLFKYWDYSSQICLLAILLDPQLKEMSFANEETRYLIFGSAQRSQEFTDELDSYLNLRRTPLAIPDRDPLLW
ncbi:15688_t:CDS:2 [Cetraspora pellucida]|uniref:15688_t:CDS:1 n=1 Tax=Cetraspora pellucida TaxID=1433469 RepID=A0ACA9N3I4_9GLOM|nr:15688_t:CDS:2 [Cetraspora pellucida]